MRINDWLRLTAGTVVMAGLVLSFVHHPYWMALVGFVSLNLVQSAFSGWCPMMALLRRLGVEE